MENISIQAVSNSNMSQSIGKLSEALSKAQAVIEGAKKDASNPFFKSSYSTLASVWDACRKPLSDNGLSIVQTTEFMPDHPEMVCIDTILCHASGEWIKGRLVGKPVKNDPQGVGSCITYFRRYSLQSMVGIAPEDDDGNAASGKGKEAQVISPEQKALIINLIKTKGVEEKAFLEYMKTDSIDKITDFQRAKVALDSVKGKK